MYFNCYFIAKTNEMNALHSKYIYIVYNSFTTNITFFILQIIKWNGCVLNLKNFSSSHDVGKMITITGKKYYTFILILVLNVILKSPCGLLELLYNLKSVPLCLTVFRIKRDFLDCYLNCGLILFGENS